MSKNDVADLFGHAGRGFRDTGAVMKKVCLSGHGWPRCGYGRSGPAILAGRPIPGFPGAREWIDAANGHLVDERLVWGSGYPVRSLEAAKKRFLESPFKDDVIDKDSVQERPKSVWLQALGIGIHWRRPVMLRGGGANTYIGNAPNFMVRSIAESSGVKMPSFFSYMAWSIGILVPSFILVTVLFIKD